MHTASQALAIERQASAQPSLAERVSRPKTRAILGLMRLNFLSVPPAGEPVACGPAAVRQFPDLVAGFAGGRQAQGPRGRHPLPGRHHGRHPGCDRGRCRRLGRVRVLAASAVAGREAIRLTSRLPPAAGRAVAFLNEESTVRGLKIHGKIKLAYEPASRTSLLSGRSSAPLTRPRGAGGGAQGRGQRSGRK